MHVFKVQIQIPVAAQAIDLISWPSLNSIPAAQLTDVLVRYSKVDGAEPLT